AEARAELRRALGDRLPPRAFAVEAALLADRLERREPAIELLVQGLRLHPDDADLLVALEELCAAAGEQTRFVALLLSLLAEQREARSSQPQDAPSLVRMAEKLARAARAVDQPRACLDALDMLPATFADRPELLELRDWAVRGLGGVEEELERLDARILAARNEGGGGDLQLPVARMLRLLGEAGEPCARRLLALAARSEGDELERALSRTALRIAREYAPDQLAVAIDALQATVAIDSIRAVAAWWAGIEHLAVDTGEVGALAVLLRLAIAAEREGQDEYGERADRLTAAALRLEPGSAEVLRLVFERAADRGEPWRAVADRLVAGLDLRGAGLSRFWSGVALIRDALEPDARAELDAALRTQAEASLDDREAFGGLLGLLRSRGCWSLVLDLLLWAGERRVPVTLTVLDELAAQAESAGDHATRQRARMIVAARASEEGDDAGAAEAYADALAAVELLAPEVSASPAGLQLRLGLALARARRPDAALERLLPLLDHSPEQLVELLGEHLREQDLSPAGLARRCGELLREVQQLDRSIALYERVLTLDPDDDDRGASLEALFTLELERGEEAAAAAVAERALQEGPKTEADQLRWLLRLAEHGEGGRRVD
ncbi:MAG: hypothetical protein KC431_28495, partial [Myxococcales bacterium]|nr:hypothetical protein [Myxococcales bacterium]